MVGGFFLGGAAAGSEAARTRRLQGERQEAATELQQRGLDIRQAELGQNRRLREKAFDLQERQFAAAEKRDATSELNKQYASTIAGATAIVDAAIEAASATGDTSRLDAALGAADETIDSAKRIGAALGQDTERAKAVLRARAQAAVTSPEARSAAEGQAAAAKSQAQAAGLEAGGVSPRAAQTAAGIAEPTIATLTFELPSGEARSVRADDADAIDAMLAQGANVVPRQRTATTIPPSPTAISQKQIDETRENIRKSSATLEEIENTRRAFAENPEAAGISGLAIDKLGGVIQQIPFVGEPVLEATGVDPAAVTKARTQAIQLVGRTLQTITGDESGRYSDAERRIADEALKTLSPTASKQQVQAALETANRVELDRLTREADRLRLGAKIKANELLTVEGLDRMGDVLQQNGLTEQQARDVIKSLAARLGLIGRGT